MKYEPDRAGGAFAETEPGPDGAGIRPSEKRENVPERCCGKSAVLRRRKRRDHSAVTAGCGDGIDAFGDSKLRESRTAALTGICRQYRRTGKAQRACDNQSAAVRTLMAAFFTPWKQKVPLLCDGEGNGFVFRPRKIGKQPGIFSRGDSFHVFLPMTDRQKACRKLYMIYYIHFRG